MIGRPSAGVTAVVRSYDVLVLVSALWFMALFLRYLFPPLFETLQSIHQVSNTMVGLLLTLLLLGYTVVQIPAGILADRYSEESVIVGGAVLFGAASYVVVLTTSYVGLIVAAVLLGIGTGPHKTVSIPLLSRQYPQRTGMALGLMDTVGQFGGVVAPIVVAVVLASLLPWYSAFAIGGLCSILLGGLFFFRTSSVTLRGATHDRPFHLSSVLLVSKRLAASRTTLRRTVRSRLSALRRPGSYAETRYYELFRDPKFVAFFVVAVAVTFSWNGLSTFLPLYLIDQKGLSAGTAGLLYGLLFFMSTSQTITGPISDRYGRLTISIVLLVLMIGTIPLVLVVDTIALLVVGIVLMGAGYHGFRPVRDSYFVDVVPDSIGSSMLGIIRTVMSVFGSVAPLVIGYLTDAVGFTVAFLSISAVVLAGLLLVVSSH